MVSPPQLECQLPEDQNNVSFGIILAFLVAYNALHMVILHA